MPNHGISPKFTLCSKLRASDKCEPLASRVCVVSKHVLISAENLLRHFEIAWMHVDLNAAGVAEWGIGLLCLKESWNPSLSKLRFDKLSFEFGF
jgi:hypothetical protein